MLPASPVTRWYLAFAAFAAGLVLVSGQPIERRTPAASPLPGHLLAAAGPAGRWVTLILLTGTALAFATWLALRPPRSASQAAIRLAVALAALCMLAPAARWGYYGYPLALLGWLGLSRAGVFCSYSSERTVLTPSASPAAASVAGAVSTAD